MGIKLRGVDSVIARLVVFFSLLTGAVVAACIADWNTSEIVMSRWLYEDKRARRCVASIPLPMAAMLTWP